MSDTQRWDNVVPTLGVFFTGAAPHFAKDPTGQVARLLITLNSLLFYSLHHCKKCLFVENGNAELLGSVVF